MVIIREKGQDKNKKGCVFKELAQGQIFTLVLGPYKDNAFMKISQPGFNAVDLTTGNLMHVSHDEKIMLYTDDVVLYKDKFVG